ncbi:MAG: radical SAM protein [Candidatus Omnitrophica bacterium]|nr:radical SAM protein [Candidatus Omnitrophota bacterium]
MEVLIINPPIPGKIKYIREGRCEQRLSSFQYMMPPISLVSIAALLEKNGFRVKVLECIGKNLQFKDVEKEIAEFKPGLLIINFSTATYFNDLKFAGLVRNLTSAHLTAIGVHVSALPQETLTQSRLDSVVRGEPETACLDLAQAILQRKGLERVRNLSFKDKQAVVDNLGGNFIEDLNTLPYPARHLIDNNCYSLPTASRPYTMVISSRGCPYKCIFCTARQYYGEKPRFRDPKNIITEVEEIIGRFKIKDIVMWADTFTLNRDLVMEFCALIKSRNLKFNWMCNSRVDKVDEEMLITMRNAGCKGIAYGIESGVQSILDSAKKGINLNQIERAFCLTRRAKIPSLGHVILGLPGETPGTIKETLNFLKKLNPDYAQFYCAIPFPGTDFYSLAKNNGWLVTDNWSNFELNQAIIKTPLLSEEELRLSRKSAYAAFYLRPGYIFKKMGRLLPMCFSGKPGRKIFSFLKDWIV